MRKIMTCTLVFTAMACSSTKDIINVSGVERVKIDQKDYVKPEFYIGNFEIKRQGRSIASVAEPVDTNLSNRQLYFLTLYQQQLNLSALTGVNSEINACPSFHNLLLDHPGQSLSTEKLDYSKVSFETTKSDAKNIGLYPVLALPYNESSDLYSKLVSVNWRNPASHVEKALNNLQARNKEELKELCDKGISAGYYTYENIVTYFKTDKKYFGTKEGLKALLKVPTLGNMIVLDNLVDNNYHFNKGSTFDSWLLTRSNANWFIDFREHLKKNREARLSKFIKR